MRLSMCGPGKTAIVLAAALGLFGTCSYSPQLKSGQLLCSENRECPRGYTCSSANRCCANGDLSCGGAVTGSGGGSGSGGSGSGGRAADFIGTWTFGATAKVLTECDNNKTGTSSLAQSTLAITAAGGSGLTANWSVWQAVPCPTAISLSYDATGAHLVDTAWYCEDNSQDPSTAWQVNSFDVIVVNATNATHTGLYYREDIYDNGTTVVCQQTVTATMTKSAN